MNLFDDIVMYIDAQVKTVDPNLSFYAGDVFGQEDISDFFADKNYKFWFGNISFNRDGSSHVELINCTLQVFSNRAIESDRAFRDIYCKALDIKQAIVDTQDQDNGLWTDITATSLGVEPLDADDNIVICTLEFIIRRDLGF